MHIRRTYFQVCGVIRTSRADRTMRQLVEASIAPLPLQNIAGTCGRDKCVCDTCWVRHA